MTSSEYRKIGDEKRKLGDYPSAIINYTKAIEVKSNNELAYLGRGRAKSKMNDYNGAIADYTKAIQLDPKYLDAYYSRGFVKSVLKDYQGAIADFTKVIELDPTGSLAYVNRGVLKSYLNDYQGGIVDYTKAIELDPNHADAYSVRGFEKAIQQDYHGALADCNKAIELNPKEPNNYCNRGIAKIGLNDHQGAVSDFRKAFELEPKYEEIYNKLSSEDKLKEPSIYENCCFLNAYTEMNKLGYKPEDESKIEHYANQVIRICDEFNRNVERFYIYIHDILCDAFVLKKEYDRAIQELDNIINELIDDNPVLWKYYTKKAKLYLELDNEKKAIDSYKIAHHVCCDNVEKIDLNKELQKLISEFNDKFIELPYQQRQWVIVDDNKVAISDTFVVLEKNNLPLTLNFPPRHPLTKEFYVGHPFVNTSYIPFSEYDESLFIDRYDEFKLFVQCLGAKSMTIEVIKGSESSLSIINNRSSNNSSSISGSASVGFKAFEGNLSRKSNDSSNSSRNSNKDTQEDLLTSRATIQRFNPTKKPYLSSKLIWFNNEPTWQRLYEQRMAGSMLHHSETWSSKSNYSISEKEESNLKKAFKDFISGDIGIKLFSAKAEISTDSSSEIEELVEKTFNKSESIEWSIKIEFEPIENLLEDNIESEFIKTIADNSSTSNKNEDEYLEEIKFMLEDDGVIDEKERSILERFRERKGISKERAEQLENSILSFGGLTEEEQEYLEEYREILKDGEITEKERRILSRMAGRLGISEERVKELEI